MITYEAAISEIFSRFSTAWAAGTTAICGYIPAVIWQGVTAPAPDPSKYFCRVSQQTVHRGQKTLANTSKVFETTGLVTVQLFCPISDVARMQKGRKLVQVVFGAFDGKKTPGGVTFKDTKDEPLNPEPDYERFNVFSTYQYDEIVGG